MDGNRRWARERGLPTVEGHRQGADRFKETVGWLKNRGVKHVAIYAFSTENWGRSDEEVNYLMDLIRDRFLGELEKLGEEGVRIKVVGQRDRFPADVQDVFTEVEERTAHNDALTIWACLSYGGRAEILKAAGECGDGEVTEEQFNARLWTAGMPDPDIVVRTGGAKRLSGFLTWQSVYSELFFIEPYWPDFSEEILDGILNEYAERERRHGK